MTFGSLFAGIGGMDLGLERAGMTCAWQVEIDDYCRRVLARHWPEVPRYEDVRTVGAAELAGVDLIAGGFPCQDISYAGRGAGLAGERSGLWFEFARIVRELEPQYVLVENVAALLGRGLDAVLGTLASLGYDAEWHCLPAAAVGAPHIRDRVFVVAYANGGRQQRTRTGGMGENAGADGWHDVSGGGAVADAEGERRRAGWQGRPSGDCAGQAERARGPLPHTDGQRCEELDTAAVAGKSQQPCWPPDEGHHPHADECGCHRGTWLLGPRGRRELADFCGTVGAEQWAAEPAVGRVADGVSRRVDRLRGLGNAVVPQVAEVLGRAILAHAGEVRHG